MPRVPGKTPSAKAGKTPKAIGCSAFVKSICDVMRRSNCASALQYVPELTWIQFLRILDTQEGRIVAEALARLNALMQSAANEEKAA